MTGGPSATARFVLKGWPKAAIRTSSADAPTTTERSNARWRETD